MVYLETRRARHIPESWPADTPLVILCGGKGQRFGGDLPKTLVPVNGKPLVQHVIDFWEPEDIIFVVSREWKDHPASLNVHTAVTVIQQQPLGIAHAIARVEGLVTDRFVVALGDCIQRGEFMFPPRLLIGVGGWEDYGTIMLRRSNLILSDDEHRVTQAIEKPHLYTGMGTYFFDRRVFNYIGKLEPSERGELEVNDLLQIMVEAGEPVHVVPFNGDYLNVTLPEDIETAERMMI